MASGGHAEEPWQRNVWALALCVFIAFVGFQFFSPFLPLYVQELGVTDPAAVALWSGLLAATTPAVSGFLAPLSGRLADRFGRKLMVIRSLAAFTVIIALMGLVTSVRQLLAARVLQGLFAGFTPLAMAMASVAAPRDRVSVAIARVQGAQLLSVAVGPVAGGLVATHLGLRAAFFVTAALCGVALVVLVALFDESRPPPGGPGRLAGPRGTPLREALRYPHFLAILALLLIAQLVDRALALLVPLHVAHLPGMEAAAATSGLIISVAAVAAAAAASGGARLARALPAGRVLLGGLVAGGPLCAAMGFAGGWVPLLALRTLAAVCLGGALTLAYALGGLVVPADRRGAAFGWLALAVQFGSAASPLLTGALAAISLPGAFVVTGALAWTAAAVLALAAPGLLARGDLDPTP
jgi:DHA1 family multidrug resistance protein-like MFS transporter